jgi:hypothetical protein
VSNILFSNNASALLAATIGSGDTSIQVAAGYGALFPNPGAGQYFMVTLVDDNGDIEVCQCTARSTDILTVVRGQEGTTAQAFTLNVTRVELRITALQLSEFVQINGDTLTGDLNFDGNEAQNAVLTGSQTSVQAGECANGVYRGATGVTGNQILVPSNGTSRATAGGADILVDTDDLMQYLDTAGVITFDSATVGVVVENTAYLDIQGTAAGDRLRMNHDDTDFNFVFGGTTEVNWSGAPLRMAANLILDDNDLSRCDFLDFSVKSQSKTATTTTTIDYELGSYVQLALSTNIGSLVLSNPPATGTVGVLRLKITQGAGGQTITWPASVKWTDGNEPTLSTAGGAIDFVDLWTDDGGTTWYGTFGLAFA